MSANTGDLVIIAVATNGGPLNGAGGGVAASGTATGLITFSRRANVGGAGANDIETWYGFATTGWVAGTLTVTVPTANQPNYVDIHAFALSGVNATPFDGAGSSQSTSADCSITTGVNNAFVYASYRAGVGTATPGTNVAWALTDPSAGANFHLTQWFILATAGALSAPYSNSLSGNGCLIESIAPAVAGGGGATRTLMGVGK